MMDGRAAADGAAARLTAWADVAAGEIEEAAAEDPAALWMETRRGQAGGGIERPGCGVDGGGMGNRDAAAESMETARVGWRRESGK